MIAEAKASYKSLLKQVIELRGNGGANAYKRAKILVDVYEHSDFILQECAGNALDAERKLDDYVQDLCLSFMELRDMLKHFKRPTDWKAGRLKAMHREMLRAQHEARQKQKPEKPKSTQLPARERAIVAEREALAAKSRAAYLEKQVQRQVEPASSKEDGKANDSRDAVVSVTLDPSKPSVNLESPLRAILVAWLKATNAERCYLIDAPEFQAWCRERGFAVVRQRLGMAGH